MNKINQPCCGCVANTACDDVPAFCKATQYVNLSPEEEYSTVQRCFYTENVIPIEVLRSGKFEKDCPLLVNTVL